MVPNSSILAEKIATYCAAIATVFFSHVKISCFRAKAHLVFHWCLYNKYRILHGSLEIRNFSTLEETSHLTCGHVISSMYHKNTEIHSVKNYVVNFNTQMSYNQSEIEERTMFFTRENQSYGVAWVSH